MINLWYHYPVKPCKFAYVADVSSAADHNGLWHFAIGHVNVITCIGATRALSSMQWPQRTLGDSVFIILRDTPRFNSRIHPSAACCHGEYGLVCLAWQSASLNFLLKLPRVCSFEPSSIMVGGTPSRWNNRDKLSWALPFVVKGCARDQPNDVA